MRPYRLLSSPRAGYNASDETSVYEGICSKCVSFSYLRTSVELCYIRGGRHTCHLLATRLWQCLQYLPPLKRRHRPRYLSANVKKILSLSDLYILYNTKIKILSTYRALTRTSRSPSNAYIITIIYPY